MKLLERLIDIATIHENQADCFIVEGTMLQNFGPWVTGQEVTLSFDFVNGLVEQHDDEGVRLAAATFELFPTTMTKHGDK